MTITEFLHKNFIGKKLVLYEHNGNYLNQSTKEWQPFRFFHRTQPLEIGSMDGQRRIDLCERQKWIITKVKISSKKAKFYLYQFESNQGLKYFYINDMDNFEIVDE